MGDLGAIGVLLERGEKITRKSGDEQNLLHVAAEHNQRFVLEFIFNKYSMQRLAKYPR